MSEKTCNAVHLIVGRRGRKNRMVQSQLRKRSRRKAYRFSGDRLPVLYKTRLDDGEAVLRDISTSGCALSSVTVPVLLQEKVLVILVLPGEKEKIEATGIVTRVEDNNFAVFFTLIEPSTVKLIQTFFFKTLRKKNVKRAGKGL